MCLFAFALNRPGDGGRLQPCSHATRLCPGPSFILSENPIFVPVSAASTRLHTPLEGSSSVFSSDGLNYSSSSVSKWGPHKCSLPGSSHPRGLSLGKAQSPRFSWPHSYEARTPVLWHWLSCPHPVELSECTVRPQNLSH